jgi:hypothetical protein
MSVRMFVIVVAALAAIVVGMYVMHGGGRALHRTAAGAHGLHP